MASNVLERFEALRLAVSKEKYIPGDTIAKSLSLQYN